MNLARQARVTASAEYSKDHPASTVADGKLSAIGAREVHGNEWAVSGLAHDGGVRLNFEWDKPQQIAEVVFFGRRTQADESWKDYAVFLDDAEQPVLKGTLRPVFDPQRISLPNPITAKKVALLFTAAHAGPNPGAAEILVFPTSPSDREIAACVEEAMEKWVPKQYVRKGSWAATMLATREAVRAYDAEQSDFEPWASQVLRRGQEPERVSLNVAGLDRFWLVAEDTGDGIAQDHAVWAEAKLIAKDGTATYLDAIDPVSAKTGWLDLLRNCNFENKPLSIAGREFEHGLFAHAYSEICYDLGGRFERFEALVGLCDTAMAEGSVRFRAQERRDPVPSIWRKMLLAYPQLAAAMEEDLEKGDHLKWFRASAEDAGRLHQRLLDRALEATPRARKSLGARRSALPKEPAIPEAQAQWLELYAEAAAMRDAYRAALQNLDAVNLAALKATLERVAERETDRSAQTRALEADLRGLEERRTRLLAGVEQGDVASEQETSAFEKDAQSYRAQLVKSMANIDNIVFAVRREGDDGHWYANFAYYAEDDALKTYRTLGQLCKLNTRTGEVAYLIDDPEGTVRDPQVHYDGKTIVFSYRPGGDENFHLYEIQSDGSGLRRLTDGPYDDIEPCYLPDGGIVFCSGRCKRWVNCWMTQVAIVHRCDADGGNIRPLSANIEQDNTPWPLPDGRLLYQRWEYVDRSQVHYHHLWTMNPDGTGQMVYYGNMRSGVVMIDAKPLPGPGNRIVSVFSPGHGMREHAGEIVILSQKRGPDDPSAVRVLTPGNFQYRDPYPLSEDCFLVASGSQLLAMDSDGGCTEFYRLPDEVAQAGATLHEPRPLRSRPRERVIPSHVDLEKPTGRLILADVYRGRHMEGVERGEVKSLLVVETLPKPINFTGGMEPLSYGGTFTLERILGTVPVEADGSAHFEVPASRSVFLVAQDADGNSIKRMQSFLTVMPGETLSCVGCHESRTQSPANTGGASMLAALERPASAVELIDGIPDVFDFPRDIQPILDRHCLECHDTDKRKGGVLMTGDRGPLYSHSYFTLSARLQISDGRNRAISNYPPRGIGSSASPLMRNIVGLTDDAQVPAPHSAVRLTPRERNLIRYWIDTGAPYPGTYAGLGCGMIGGYARNVPDRTDTTWPSMKAAMGVLERRCAECHAGSLALPTSPSDNLNMPPWDVDYASPKLRFSRHILYNLTRPERSLQILAPLAREAGGYGACRRKDAAAEVFASADDPDFQILLAAIRDTKKRLDEIKRFDMPGFQPRPAYVREMQRYGILPRDLAENAPVDPYALDRAYWAEAGWRPQAP